MKKSEMYHLLQKLVMVDNDYFTCYDEKLEVLRELMRQEALEKFSEEQETAVKSE